MSWVYKWIKLESINKKIYGKFKTISKLNKILLNNLCIKKYFQGETVGYFKLDKSKNTCQYLCEIVQTMLRCKSIA